MKVGGRVLEGRYGREVVLPRGDGSVWTFRIQALPLGFHRRLRERRIEPPPVPTRVVRDSGGKAMRDERGLAVLAADDSDAEYRRELELYHQRVAVLAVVEALRSDPDVEFETRPPATNDWRAYADDLYEELERSGWAAGDLITLCQEVCRLSNLVDDHLREAGRNFSQPPPAGP